MVIKSQLGSAWHCYIDRLLSKGLLPRFGLEKDNEYFGTELCMRNNLGMIYKLTKFGADRLRNGVSTWW